ncbi:MAG TPA: AI-2E family transporter [Cyclobacteriaceae bacterium]
MEDITNPKSGLSRVAYWFIIISCIIVFLIYFRGLLQPFILALVVWFLIIDLRALIGRIKIGKKPIPKWLRGTLSFIFILSMLGLVEEFLSYNVELIIRKMPEYEKNLQFFYNSIEELSGLSDLSERINEAIQTLKLESYISGLVSSLTSLLGNFVLIVIYLVFLLIEESIFYYKLKAIFPTQRRYEEVTRMLDRINHSINRYLSIKTLISLLTGFLSYIVLFFLEIDFPFLWAFIIFLFNYIPYIGSLIATLLPAFFAVFQYASIWPFVYVLVSVEAVQLLVGNYIEPRVMGKSLNLSPLVVILALSFWGTLWGVLGMVISVPIMSIITLVLAGVPSTRNVAILLSGSGDIE